MDLLSQLSYFLFKQRDPFLKCTGCHLFLSIPDTAASILPVRDGDCIASTRDRSINRGVARARVCLGLGCYGRLQAGLTDLCGKGYVGRPVCPHSLRSAFVSSSSRTTRQVSE